ncbi:MAG TPA: SMI1/KNR4 family protein [Myxococcales bacterium]|nr:SMI1/KNR4 family protein [Myxococcales bacterium]HIN85058.1 SMI1/KNR4 family protein [Myxococcales bacterium]
MTKRAPKKKTISGLLESQHELFEAGEPGCNDTDIAELESAIGQELPADIVEILQLSDGCVLHVGHEVLYLATCAQIRTWHADGVVDELEVFPFAHNGSDTLLLFDEGGAWGGENGSVYRLQIGRRVLLGYPIQDAIYLAGSIYQFLEYLIAGEDLL